ncbi:MAG: putative lipid II flippase FtsW [Acidimicrobiia bacterium]
MTVTTVPTRAARERRRAPAVTAAPGVYLLLFAVISVLALIGLVMVLSASSVIALHEHANPYHYFGRQALWLAGGTVLFVITLRTDYHRFRRLATPMLVLCLALLVMVLVPGVGTNANGSSRWLGFGSLSLQPSEFAKLAVLLFSADLLARRADRIDDCRATLRPVLVVLAAVAALIMLQPNLGTTIIVVFIGFAVLFTAGVPLGPLAGCSLAGGGLALAASVTEGYRRARLFAFLHPWQDPSNTGYQTIQSQVSLASGGWLGVGLGASRAKWGFLPYAHTDFIFAIIGEELGLVGATLVVGLFVLLGALGIRAAMTARDTFGRLVAVGVTAWLCGQAFVNIGAVVGVLPITGVPLPFVSFGGSSMLSTMAAAGILCNVARQPRRERSAATTR